MIHSTAIIHEDAKISDNVTIGPYSIVEANAVIGKGTKIGSHCVIGRNTILGEDNIVSAFASVGSASQSRGGYLDLDGRVEIGNRNVIHEYCTINRGLAKFGGVTRLGDDNVLMVYSHVGHDCSIGHHVTLVNNATLAGHVILQNTCIIGAFVSIRQFVTIGAYSFATESAVLIKDVLPFLIVRRNPATVAGVNRIGLQRHGFTDDEIKIIAQAYRAIFKQGLTSEAAVQWLSVKVTEHPVLQPMLDLLKHSERGIVR